MIWRKAFYTDGRYGGIFGADRRLSTIYELGEIDQYFWPLDVESSSKYKSPVHHEIKISLITPRIMAELLPLSNSGGSSNGGRIAKRQKPNPRAPRDPPRGKV